MHQNDGFRDINENSFKRQHVVLNISFQNELSADQMPVLLAHQNESWISAYVSTL